jgi:hypothetical protein
MKARLVCFLFWILMVSCREKQQTLFTLLPSSQTGVKFANTIQENADFNIIDYYYVYNGGGVSVGDINNDGLPDLYFTGNQVADKLYLNKGKTADGELHFEDITATAGIKTGGWSTGVTMADVNADGLMDIYVCKSGNYPAEKRKNQLYLNKGNLRFEESAERLGIADTTFTNQAAFLDYDKDGDLDLFLITSTNLVRNPNKLVAPVNDGTGLSADKLYRNDAGRFTDVSTKAGIVHDGMSLGLSVADFNGDGWDDIMVGNDFLSSDLLYLNNQDGTFRESAKEAFGHHSQFTMGTDAADFNNDGKVDLMTVDMLPADNEQRKLMAGPANFQQFEMARQLGYHPQYMRNMLQLNAGAGKTDELSKPVHFSEIGQFSGVHSTDWSWSPLFADFDNDGYKDLCITNGYLRDITDLDFVAYNAEMAEGGASKEIIDNRMKAEALKMKTLKKSNFIYRNNGDLTFTNQTKEWFGDAPSLSNGSAYADLDGDGDLDLVVNNINQEAFIFQNNTVGKHFLNVNLKGKKGNVNGLGAEITLYAGGGLQQINHSVTRGYQSSSDYQVHFGLGNAKLVDSVRVIWPDGKSQTLKKIAANQVLTLNYENAGQSTKYEQVVVPILKDVTVESSIDYRHVEEPYMDYNQEPMLPHMLSRQGPKLAVGDVNGDGLEDFYVGGSYHHQGSFYIQNAFGKFSKKPINGVIEQKDEEDTGVLLADLDGDKDLDLYIVSGSNEYFDGSEYYQDRIYVNDGLGNFTAALNLLPAIRHSGSCVVAADFDHDGDLDLFRGGRLMPLGYPKAGESCILRNDNGHFTDVTDSVAPQLRNIGMVTDAVWADVDNDSWPDLMLTGELMPLTLFKNTKGRFSNLNSFPFSNGFWNCVKAADFDRDGDLDFVAGNLGLNSRYRFSKTQPMSAYSADLDGNGRYDAIPSYFLNGIEYPVPSRDELTRQIPVFKKRFQSYALYSNVTMSELLTAEQQKTVTVSKAFEQQSVYIENKGAGKFEIKPLPQIAQLSVVQDILIDDADGDGNLDVLLAGNDYTTEPGAGQYDASYGVFLKGNGKGNFQSVATEVSGFFVNGDCRSIRKITGKKSYYVVSRNKAGIMVFAKK